MSETVRALIGARRADGSVTSYYVEFPKDYEGYSIDDARRDVGDLVQQETQQPPRVVLACIQGGKS
jgi:hypothetical protein